MMGNRNDEEEIRKKRIFDGMSPRRQQQILKRGYHQWDPFLEPKDPIDIRQDKSKRTSQQLIREFLQSRSTQPYGNAFARGAFEICLGMMNEDEKYQGMYEFACWHMEMLKREGLLTEKN